MPLQDVVRQGFGPRLFQAHAALEGREGARISRVEIARRVGMVLGNGTPNENTVTAWFTRGVVPPAEVGVGIAKVYGVTPGWLYFNQLPMSVPETQEPVTESYGEMTTDPRRKRRAK